MFNRKRVYFFVAKYDIEFKLEIVSKINKHQLSVDEAAQKYGVNRTSVRKWLDLYNLYGAEGLIAPKNFYTGEFKRQVIEDMHNNNLSARETGLKYQVSHATILNWERKYSEGGFEALQSLTGFASKLEAPSKGRPRKFMEQAEEDLATEVQRLRMENDYLKKLKALVQQKK